MTVTRGRLIVFEGPDDVGKTTLAERTVQEIKRRGQAVVYLSFPGRIEGTLGHLVYQIHHGADVLKVQPTPAAIQALHIAAHVDVIEQVILPALEAGVTVVLDRYLWSTYVYGNIDGLPAVYLKSLIAAEQVAWGGELPSQLFCVLAAHPYPSFTGDVERWQAHGMMYKIIMGNWDHQHPTAFIKNDGTVDEAVAKIMGKL